MHKEPLRVCHIVSGDGWGGAETILLSLLCAQAESGDVRPSLIVLNDGYLADQARASGLPVQLVPEKGQTLWSLASALRRALIEVSPQIIHSHRYKENLLSFVLAGGIRARRVVTIHGFEPATDFLQRATVKLRDTFTFWLGRLVGARFVAVSKDLRQLYGLCPRQCIVIPNGIRFSVSLEQPIDRTKRNLQGVPVIGWIGRMVPIKGLDTLLEATAILASSSRKVALMLIGDGPQRKDLERKACHLGIASQVQFRGFVSNTQPYLACMDILALPSYHEGVPLVLLEALGAGVPTVASDVGGIPEVIGDSGAACLVASRSPQAWATAIGNLLSDQVKARMMGERGRSLIKERFSVEQMASEYASLYQRVMF